MGYLRMFGLAGNVFILNPYTLCIILSGVKRKEKATKDLASFFTSSVPLQIPGLVERE